MADMKWYVVHVYSGFEKKIAQQIREQAAQKGLADAFDEILVPSEEVTEVRRGQKINTERKFFPGYVLVKMAMSDDAWHLVKDTPKVTGFVLGKQPEDTRWISDGEVERLTTQVSEATLKPKPRIQFENGDAIRVIDGPLSGFNGTVEEVNPDKGRLRVLVSIFGRATPYELDFLQVEKAQ